jgi:MFS family permease
VLVTRRLRDRWLVGVCVSRVLLYATFMVYPASLTLVRQAWDVTAARAALVSTAFTLAYAFSLVVFSALAGRHGARRVALWSAWASGATALLFAAGAHGYWTTLVLYGAVGLAQGGVYTPLILLMADRSPPAARGRAVGWLISSTSIGYAGSLLVSGLALSWGGYRLAFALTGLLSAGGTVVLVFALRGTAAGDEPRARDAIPTATSLPREARRLIAGYCAHSWELLGMWAWMPAFLAAAVAGRGGAAVDLAEWGAYLAGGLHLLGAIAAASMGRLSDRAGRRAVLVSLAGASAALSFTIGWSIGWPILLVVTLAAVYSFTALGDSPVLSAALTETVSSSRLGTVLGLRSLLGFGAGAIAPWAFGLVLDATNPGTQAPQVWGWAFAVLGLGGAIATLSAWRLPRMATTPGAGAARPSWVDGRAGDR